MKIRSSLYYEARVIFGWASLIAMLILPGYALLYWLLWRDGLHTSLAHMIRGFEMALPLSAVFASAHVMVVEREVRFDELRRTYPEHPLRLPLIRTAGALLVIALGAACGALCFRLGAGHYPLWTALGPGVAPTLWLTGLALLIGNISGSYWAAMGLTSSYWLLELMTEGSLTRALFLFARSMPPDPPVDYGMNRWLLAALGAVLLVLNVWVTAWRRKGRVS